MIVLLKGSVAVRSRVILPLGLVVVLVAGCFGPPPSVDEDPVETPPSIVFDLSTYDLQTRAVSGNLSTAFPERSKLGENERGVLTFDERGGSVVFSTDGRPHARPTYPLLIAGAFLDEKGTVLRHDLAEDGWFVARIIYPGESELSFARGNRIANYGQIQMAIGEASWASPVTSTDDFAARQDHRPDGYEWGNAWILIAYKMPEAAHHLALALAWRGTGTGGPWTLEQSLRHFETTTRTIQPEVLARSDQAKISYWGDDLEPTWARMPNLQLNLEVHDESEIHLPELLNLRKDRVVRFTYDTGEAGPGWSESWHRISQLIPGDWHHWQDNGTARWENEGNFEDNGTSLPREVGDFYHFYEDSLYLRGGSSYNITLMSGTGPQGGGYPLVAYFLQTGIDWEEMTGLRPVPGPP